VRDAQLFRRPPFLTGDEVVVSRWSRRWRIRRRWVRFGYLGAGVALIVVGDALGFSNSGLIVVALAVLTLGFMVAFLWAGARMAMKPMEAYEDGIVGTELRFPLGRKRFLLWREVHSADLETDAQGPPRLKVAFGNGRFLSSVPGELGPKDQAAIALRIAKSGEPLAVPPADALPSIGVNSP
jgi:hypothetical protein